jgi:hypothetical protein
MTFRFSVYKSGISSRRYTALRTTRLSATAPRNIGAIISSSVGGGGSSARVLKWYAHKGVSAKQYYKNRYPGGVIIL